MPLIKLLDYIAKIGGAVALILGLAIWNGVLTGLSPLHIGLGIAIVLSLWVLAVLAWRRGAGLGLVAAAIVWGIATLALGFGQTQLLVGTLHWIVQVAHLALGLGAIAFGTVLSRTAASHLQD